MKARTTLKLTSASRSATRISRSAYWMFSSDSRPRPPSLSKMACSLVPRESSMGGPNSTELRAEFQQLLQVLYTFWFERPDGHQDGRSRGCGASAGAHRRRAG